MQREPEQRQREPHRRALQQQALQQQALQQQALQQQAPQQRALQQQEPQQRALQRGQQLLLFGRKRSWKQPAEQLGGRNISFEFSLKLRLINPHQRSVRDLRSSRRADSNKSPKENHNPLNFFCFAARPLLASNIMRAMPFHNAFVGTPHACATPATVYSVSFARTKSASFSGSRPLSSARAKAVRASSPLPCAVRASPIPAHQTPSPGRSASACR